MFWTRGGSSNADVRTFGDKNLEFLGNLWCIRTDKVGRVVELVRIFSDRGSIFCDFVRTHFMDGPLRINIRVSHILVTSQEK